MAIAFVQVTEVKNAASGSATLSTFSATAGNGLICLSTYFIGSATTATVTVSGGGGTWTNDLTGKWAYSSTSNAYGAISSAPNNSGGTHSITVNGGANAQVVVALVYEFSGLATSSMLDVAGTMKTGTVSPATTNSLTNTNANDVFVALMGNGDGNNPSTFSGSGTGWTFPTAGQEKNGSTLVVTGTGYDIVSSTGAQSPSWTVTLSGNDWSTFMACYQAAGGGGPPAVQQMLSLLGCGA